MLHDFLMIIPLAGIDVLYADNSGTNKTGHVKTQHFLPFME